MKLSAKRCELVQLTQKFVPRSHIRIFRTNASNPLHWTLNTCFGAFRSVWVHLGSFHYCMKLGAKRAELVQLMQKFVPRIRVAIFHNEPTQSNPLDTKPMIWCVLQCLVAFGIVSLLHEIWCETNWTCAINAKVRATKSRQNFSPLMHPINPIGPQTQVLVRFIVFGCIWDRFVTAWNLVAKQAELVQLMQKFVPRSRVGFFHNERIRSTPLDP